MYSLQKFDKRSSVVTATEREKYWKYLSYMYMTEESDDPDDCNIIVEHKLPWRSDSEFNPLAKVMVSVCC